MQDDEFPYLADERRAHRRTGAFTCIAIVLGITGAVRKYQRRRERAQELEDVRIVNEAMEDYRAAHDQMIQIMVRTHDRPS
jgi:hypothetical protein